MSAHEKAHLGLAREMQKRAPTISIDNLRQQIEKIGGAGIRKLEVLPFGVPPIDRHLPGGGLPMASLHEVAGGGNGALDGAAAALFVGGIAARTKGQVLWCVTRQDLFMPGLVQTGLSHNRVLIVECRDERGVLECFEEGLRSDQLGAVVGEVARMSMTASRRLQLAAETSGGLGIAIRRWRRQAEASDYGHPTAAVTRWRVSVLPSKPLAVQGIGRARWFLELMRCRGAESVEYVVEACDAKGRLHISPDLSNRSASEDAWLASTQR